MLFFSVNSIFLSMKMAFVDVSRAD